MLTLAFTLIPSPDSHAKPTLLAEAGQGSLGQLIRWVRQQVRYRRALHELRQLDDRDLDDIGIAPHDRAGGRCVAADGRKCAPGPCVILASNWSKLDFPLESEPCPTTTRPHRRHFGPAGRPDRKHAR